MKNIVLGVVSLLFMVAACLVAILIKKDLVADLMFSMLCGLVAGLVIGMINFAKFSDTRKAPMSLLISVRLRMTLAPFFAGSP